MGHGSLPVRRKPRVAILATGDELVLPGEHARPRPDRRLEPAGRSLALVDKAGGEAIDLGIARDTLEALEERIAGRAGGRRRHPRDARRRLRRRA